MPDLSQPHTSTLGGLLLDFADTRLGREMQVLIPAVNYTNVKKVFDFVQNQDSYTITLKQDAQ